MSNPECSVKQKMGKSDLLQKFIIRRGRCPDEIMSCQSELDVMNEKRFEEMLETTQQIEVLKKPYLDRRTTLIRTIPNFWVNAIKSHPQLCLLLDEEVTDVLRYMTQIEIEDSAYNENGVSVRINFFFQENPYMENERLTKERWVLIGGKGMTFETTSSSTKIIWKSNQEVGLNEDASYYSAGDSSKRKEKNFFVWFCDNEKPEDDLSFMYFQIIFQNPLPFFYDSKGNTNEETRNRMGADDHKSGILLKDVENLNINFEKDDNINNRPNDC